jgi:FixJ family two-component response regulator
MSHARRVVAIVDDEQTVRRAIERLLRARGIDSEGFSSGEKFLRSLDARRPDCLILGHQQTAAAGQDVVEQMAAADLQIPVLVLSDRTTESAYRSLRPN